MTLDISSYFNFVHGLIISASLLQTLILVNSGIMLLYCSMTALAHTTQNKTIQAIAHTVRITSLYVGGLIFTLIILNHIYGALAYSFHRYAILGLVVLLFIWLINSDDRFKSVNWIVTQNLKILPIIILVKAQFLVTGQQWGPYEVGSAWLWYSFYYLIMTETARYYNFKPYDFNKKPFDIALFRACDRYIKHIDPKDGAIRSACGLSLAMIHFTGFMFIDENVNSFVLLAVICQLIITLILAMRFCARCSDAPIIDHFVFQTFSNIEASLAVARKQKEQGILPAFNAWLFCIALLSSFNTISPAYCSGHDDEAVASPVSEGAQVSRRGASKAGEAIYRSAQQARAAAGEAFGKAWNETAFLRTDEGKTALTSGVFGAGATAYGIYQGQVQADQITESMNQVGEKITENASQTGEKVDRLSGEIERLTETTLNAQAQENAQLKAELDAYRAQNNQLSSQNNQLSSQNNQLSFENDQLKAKLESVSAQLEEAEKPKSFFSWFCSSKPRTSE